MDKISINSIKRMSVTAVCLMCITLLSKSLGFIREMLLFHFYGTTEIADAYVMAGNIVGIFFGWTATLYTCYSPYYLKVKYEKGDLESLYYSNNIISVFSIIAVIAFVIGLFFSKQIVFIAAPGYSFEAKDITETFFRISLLIVLVQPVLYTLKAYLEANTRYIFSVASDLVVSLAQLILIIVSGWIGYWLLPWAQSLPYILQTILLFAGLSLTGYHLQFLPQISEDVKNTFKMIVPFFLSGIVIEVNSYFDRYFASSLSVGSVSTLNYASVIQNFIFILFSATITTIIYPKLSERIVSDDIEGYKHLLRIGINIIVILFIPITAGIIALKDNIVILIYRSTLATTENMNQMALVLMLYGIGLLPQAIRELLFRSLYSDSNTRIPLGVGIIASISNIALNAALVQRYGVFGIAIATSISTIISAIMVSIYCGLKKHNIRLYDYIGVVFKTLLGTVVMYFIVIEIKDGFSNLGNIDTLFLCTGVGIGVYIIWLAMFMRKDIKEILK